MKKRLIHKLITFSFIIFIIISNAQFFVSTNNNRYEFNENLELFKSEQRSANFNNKFQESSGSRYSPYQTKYIEDNFFNESKIDFKENVLIDTSLGEITILEPMIPFNKTYYKDGGGTGRSIQQTSDGGYIIASTSNDAILTKIDKNGNLSWRKSFGGYDTDIGYFAAETTDKGFILFGSTYSYGAGSSDGLLIKTDKLGNLIWESTFGGISVDLIRTGQQTSDGGYIAVGISKVEDSAPQNLWLVKTDDMGNVEWNKRYGGQYTDEGYWVQQTSDEGYIITGSTISYATGSGRTWLIKTDDSGNEEWNTSFEGYQGDVGHYVQETSEGGYIITGTNKSIYHGTGKSDVALIKTNSTGVVEWRSIFESITDDSGHTVHQTSDNGYIIGGGIDGDKYHYMCLIKTNETGHVMWDKKFYGKEEYYPTFAQPTKDDGYIIVGTTKIYGDGGSDTWVIKTDSTGNMYPISFMNGTIISRNLLENDSANSINFFNCTASIYPDTNIDVQFSQDNITWYNSLGILDDFDRLGDRLNNIDLKSLDWSGNEFYYKLNFSTHDVDYIPNILNINISFTINIDLPAYTKDKPDLSIDKRDIRTSSNYQKSILVYDSIVFRIIIHNIGNASANNIKVKLWEGHPESEDRKIISTWDHDELHPNKEVELSRTPGYQFDTIGEHYIYAVIDPDNLILEMDEDNNIAFRIINVTPRLPELFILEDIRDQEIKPWVFRNGKNVQTGILLDGEKYWFNFNISNMGPRHALNFNVSIYLDHLLNELDKIFIEEIYAEKREYSITTKSIIADFSIESDNNHKIIIVIDPDYTIKELNKENNILEIPQCFTIIHPKDDPDLDGCVNEWEIYLETDPFNKSSKPLDTDNDGKPNGDENNSQPWMDYDDDNDNYNDEDEKNSNTDPLDDNDHPSKQTDKSTFIEENLIIVIFILILIFTIIIIILVRGKSKTIELKETKLKKIKPIEIEPIEIEQSYSENMTPQPLEQQTNYQTNVLSSQKHIGYFLITLGLLVAIVVPIAIIVRGGVGETRGFTLCMAVLAPYVLIIHGYRIVSAKWPVNTWSWNLERKT